MTTPRRNAATLDPITLEILWARLISIVDEAAATFVRTSFSTLVRESYDFAIVLTDTQGRSLAQSQMTLPSFIATLPATVRHLLGYFPAKTLSPGDVLITNDPWMGTGHIHDVNVVMPMFHKRKLVGFAAVTSHMPDIGGRLRGAGIREIFEEGLQIPPLKLVHKGETNQTLIDMIRQNVRVPEQTMGDIWGEVAGCRMLEERLEALLDDTGVDLAELATQMHGRSEAAMRAAIRAVPDGTYRHVVRHDGFEERIVIDCKLTVTGDAIDIDYAGSSPQLPRSVNTVPIYTYAYSAYALKAILSPDIPNNDGSFKPITTHAPEGTILNPRYPAASGARNMIGHMLPPAIMGALSPVLPEVAWAEGSANCSVTMSGHTGGRQWAVVNFFNGGQGATAKRDGYEVLSFPSNLGNTPIEVSESLAPMHIHKRAIRKGGGGRGQHTGGGGLAFAFRYDGDSPAVASFLMTRRLAPPAGLMGGEDGRPARCMINGKDIDPAEHHVLNKGDEVLVETAGGGGFGTP